MNSEQKTVYLISGFLESGKTQFIQKMLENSTFSTGKNTLVIICEEGETALDPSLFKVGCVHIRYVDEKDFTKEKLDALAAECCAERIICEYNGMWPLERFYAQAPNTWTVFQTFVIADSNTISVYNENIRQLTYDKLSHASVVIFNRLNDETNYMPLHKLVRAASSKAGIAYEHINGKLVHDNIEDLLPYDLNAQIVEIQDDDYAVWYRDLSEDTEKYVGKTVQFTANIARYDKETDIYYVGRQVMVCCAADIQFQYMSCRAMNIVVPSGKWSKITARITRSSEHKIILEAEHICACEGPEHPVAVFS